jgi:hypothetical protein
VASHCLAKSLLLSVLSALCLTIARGLDGAGVGNDFHIFAGQSSPGPHIDTWVVIVRSRSLEWALFKLGPRC